MTIRQVRPGEPYPMELLLLADPEEQAIMAYLPKSECYVLELDGVSAGVCVLLPTRPKTAEIMNIAVKEELQGKGLGLTLLRHAIRTAQEQGYSVLEIGTGNPGVSQLYLYQKAGFRIIGVDLDYFTRNYKEPIYENGLLCRDMIRLRMDLDGPEREGEERR